MVRVTVAGTGTVGRDFTRLCAATPDIEIVAACSRNPAHAGEPLAELAGVTAELPLVSARLEDVLATPSDVLVVATASHLGDVREEIRAGIAAGRNVLTSSEEAAFPWAFDADVAEELDALSREAGVTVLGTGVNPGLTYDALVLTVAGACWDVQELTVERVVDISGYSEAILRRSGVGVTPDVFTRRCETGDITGHIGFPQSMNIVADAMGQTIERIDRQIEPLLAGERLEASGMVVEPDETAGFVQHYVAVANGEPWFTAHLVAHVDMEHAELSTRDVIAISGSVSVRMVVEPSFNSQTTVAAMLANSLDRVVAAPPGWLTVAGLPPARPTAARRQQSDLRTTPEGVDA